MENASKALIMAGSVLLSLLIIGALVYMFNQLGFFSQRQSDEDAIKKLTEYNKEIETFNKETLYGSELLSLANLIDDYNKRQADLQGYSQIAFEVEMTEITGENGEAVIKSSYKGNSSYLQLLQDFNKINNKLTDLKENKILGKSISEWVGMTDFAIMEYLERNNKTSEYEKIIEKRQEYNIIESAVKELKNKKFERPQVEYDPNTGRVSKMSFKQIKI